MHPNPTLRGAAGGDRIISLSGAPYDGHPVPAMLASMAACGARHVEPAYIVGYTEPFDESSFTPAQTQQWRRWLMDAGMACHAMSSHIDLGRDDAVEVFRGRMDFARGLGAEVIHTWAELAVIGAGASVGPFTYLRPGAVLGAGAKAGAYVEIKNSTIGDGAKVPHLSYVGDAEVGAGSNIGAATVFVNYDGVEKHRTVVGEQVRIGSDSMLVAPVTIGDGAYTAAGSVITEDVPPGAMAVGRAKQRNVEGWVERKRPESASADAARKAQQQNSTNNASAKE